MGRKREGGEERESRESRERVLPSSIRQCCLIIGSSVVRTGGKENGVQ